MQFYMIFCCIVIVSWLWDPPSLDPHVHVELRRNWRKINTSHDKRNGLQKMIDNFTLSIKRTIPMNPAWTTYNYKILLKQTSRLLVFHRTIETKKKIHSFFSCLVIALIVCWNTNDCMNLPRQFWLLTQLAILNRFLYWIDLCESLTTHRVEQTYCFISW